MPAFPGASGAINITEAKSSTSAYVAVKGSCRRCSTLTPLLVVNGISNQFQSQEGWLAPALVYYAASSSKQGAGASHPSRL